jgi:hypothetical protein
MEYLLLSSILNDSFAGLSILGLKLYSFSGLNTSLYAILSFKVSVEKSAVILMGLTLYIFFLSSSHQHSFSSLCACCFNDNMSWNSPILVKFVWCPGGFLNLNGQNFLKIWEILCYYFIEYIMNPICLELFFNIHDSQVWSFD